MIQTKTIATLGPATADAGLIRQMVDTGVDVFRLNFSHGSLDQHKAYLDAIEDARDKSNKPVAVLGDLCGPKIRVGRIEPEGQELVKGDIVTIVPGDETGTRERFTTNYEFLSRDIRANQRVFIDDGEIELEVMDIQGGEVTCRVVFGAPLYSNKGLNLPDTEIGISTITPRDWACVDWAIENELDFLALSFVRRPEDVIELKTYLSRADSKIKVIAKIEKPQAVMHLEEIVNASDGILVARGDLGVEMKLEQVPLIQKELTRLCCQKAKPVIVATQMLQSMIDSPTATRAEVSDVANAMMDLCDAVMLSGETAVGKYPLKALTMINRIAKVTEAYLSEHIGTRPRGQAEESLRQTESITRNVAAMVEDLQPKCVAMWSQTGRSALLMSKTHVGVPVLAFTSDRTVHRQMCLDFGVIPFLMDVPKDIRQFIEAVNKRLADEEHVNVGDKIIIICGHPIARADATNIIVVHAITEA